MGNVQTISALTSLRFAAAAMVFLHHAPGVALPFPVGALGPAGVGFFFVLSGLILSHAYSGRMETLRQVKVYYIGRVARIWPLHVATLGLFVVLLGNVKGLPDAATFVLNALLLQGYSPDKAVYFSLNDVSWSLSAEITFYALFPLLFRAVRPIGRRAASLALAAVVALVFVWSIATAEQEWRVWAVYVLPPIRALDFLSGILLHRLLAGWQPDGTASAAFEVLTAFLVACFALLYSAVPESLRLSAIFLPAALLVIGVFYVSQGPVARMLSWRPLVYLGEISFAFYMVHRIVIYLLSETPSLANQGMMFLIALIAGVILHHAVELRGVELGRRLA